MRRMNLFVGILLLLNAAAVQANGVNDAVVKIYVTTNALDFYRPWQSLGLSSKTGTGAVIAGSRIITNAHVVSDQTFIQVRKETDPKKYTAKVEAIAHDCDLALLKVEDPDFLKDVTPLEFGELPDLKDKVTVLGYPEGGDKISITEGVVSRIEVTSYSQSSRKLLSVQIDAAINPGNSGGPVLLDGKIIGIAMQGMSNSQNIGYMIPPPVIQHFFNDLSDGRYDGFPLLGTDIVNTENPALRKYYNIQDKKGGVLIARILPYSSSDKNLLEGDIVLAINDTPIGTDGTFQFRNDERLYLSHIVNEKQVGEQLKVKVVRKGKEKDITFDLRPFAPLVPFPNHYEKPTYYIYGGLVFTVLSADLLPTWGGRWWEKAPPDFVYYVAGSGRANRESRQELVILTQVLPDDINVGYHDISNEVVTMLNGKPVTSFKDFVSALSTQNGTPYTMLETERNLQIILDNEKIEGATVDILKRNNIPFQFSDDVAQWLGQSRRAI